MQNNTTKIVAAVIAILALGGITIFAMNSNKPADQAAMIKDTMSKTSEVMSKEMMIKKEEAMKMEAMKKAEMMKNDAMSKSSDTMMKKDGEVMMKADGSKMTADETAMMKKEEAMKMEKEAMMKKEGDVMSKEDLMKKGEVSSPTGAYNQYSVTNLAQNATGTNVIFFHAAWCPSCKSIDADITANANKLPSNFQILKADFDTSTALRQKYGITSQSTFVKIDKDGNKIGTASPAFELKTVADIVAFGNK